LEKWHNIHYYNVWLDREQVVNVAASLLPQTSRKVQHIELWLQQPVATAALKVLISADYGSLRVLMHRNNHLLQFGKLADMTLSIKSS